MAKKGAILPIVSTVPRNLWGRDILEDMGAVIATGNRVFFDNLQDHEKTGLANHSPTHKSLLQF